MGDTLLSKNLQPSTENWLVLDYTYHGFEARRQVRASAYITVNMIRKNTLFRRGDGTCFRYVGTEWFRAIARKSSECGSVNLSGDLQRVTCTNRKNLWSKSATTQEAMKIKRWKHVAIFLFRILHMINQVDGDISIQRAA